MQLLVLVYLGARLSLVSLPVFGMVFIAQGFTAALRLSRQQSSGIPDAPSRGDPFDAPRA